jgi:hypothetical protein
MNGSSPIYMIPNAGMAQSTGRTYVIEAQGGVLPYEMAKNSPSKFYD